MSVFLCFDQFPISVAQLEMKNHFPSQQKDQANRILLTLVKVISRLQMGGNDFFTNTAER